MIVKQYPDFVDADVDTGALGLWRIATRDPDRIAVIDDDGRVLSYGELLEHARAIARGLHSLGLRRGDALAAVLPNHRTFIGSWLAATESGLYFVPVNSHLAPDEAAYVVANSEAKVVVGHEDLADLVRPRPTRPAFPTNGASRSARSTASGRSPTSTGGRRATHRRGAPGSR
jgi:acyl-CoA synthetase (AMP-forming)/AMP-acid ligase II